MACAECSARRRPQAPSLLKKFPHLQSESGKNKKNPPAFSSDSVNFLRLESIQSRISMSPVMVTCKETAIGYTFLVGGNEPLKDFTVLCERPE